MKKTIIFAIAALIFIQTTSLCSIAENAYSSNADWMSQHKEQLKNLPINQVTLLGSHDSASCDIRVGSPVVSGYLTDSGTHIDHHYATVEDVDSAVCQSASIKAQLEYGVRHIDLRVAYQDGQYWLTHMFISTPAFGPDGVFTQIKKFLTEHPDEVILVMGEHLYGESKPMTSEETNVFYKKLEEYFGDLLIPRDDFSKLTYGKIWEGKGRIILIANVSTGMNGDPFLWDVHAVDSTWIDQKNLDVLISELKTVVDRWKNGKSGDKLRRLQAMTSTGNKLKAAVATNARVMEMMRTEWKDAPISILQVDDAVNSGLMPLLIEKIEGQMP